MHPSCAKNPPWYLSSIVPKSPPMNEHSAVSGLIRRTYGGHNGRHKSSHRSRERHLAICFGGLEASLGTPTPRNSTSGSSTSTTVCFFFLLFVLSMEYDCSRALLKSKITLQKPSPLTPVPVLEGAPLLLSDSKSSQSLFNDALLLLLLLLSSVIVFFAFRGRSRIYPQNARESEGIAYTRPSLSTAPPPHL